MNVQTLKGLLTGAGLILGSGQALGFSLPVLSDSVTIHSADAEEVASYDFNGIVALSNCSGSVIRFAQSEPQDRALVMTNGHCISGMVPPGEIRYRQPSSRSFRLLTPEGNRAGTVSSDQLVYATMTNTDVALYRLQLSYEQLQSRYGVEALTLAEDSPGEGDPIEVISGYWRRGYTCSVESVVHKLLESDWTFKDSIRYSRPGCETIGGTSGSPVLLEGTRTVLGVNNTGNESGQECTLNNPCEVNERGEVYYERGLSYAQQTYWIYSCLDTDRNLDLNTEGCMLPGGAR